MNKNLNSKNSAIIYIISSFINGAIFFISAPIFTRLLSLEDYGRVSIFTAWVRLVAIVIGLQTNTTLAMAKIEYDKPKFEKYTTSVLTISLITAIVIYLVVFFFKNNLSNLLGFAPSVIMLIIMSAFFSYIRNFESSYLIHSKKPKMLLIITSLYTLGSIGISIIFILRLDYEPFVSKILGELVVFSIIGVILLFKFYFKGRILFELKYWKYCIPLAIPMIFHQISLVILSQSDKIMIKEIINEEAVGLYAFAYTFAGLLSMFVSATNRAWMPWYLTNTKQNKNIKKASTKYIFLMSIVTILAMFIAPDLLKIMGPEKYWDGINLIPIVLFGTFFNCLYTIIINYEFYLKKTIWIGLGSIIAALINICINFLLIPKIGLYGAAIATLLSYLLLFIIHLIIVKREGGFNIETKVFVLGIGFVALGFFVLFFVITTFFIRYIFIVILLIILHLYFKVDINNLKKDIFDYLYRNKVK